MRATRRFMFFAALLLAGGLGLAPAPGTAVAAPSNLAGGWIGVRVQDLTRDLRDALDLGRDVRGALVASVVPESPAESAGIHEGDVIEKVDGKAVDSVSEVVDAVRALEPGKDVMITVRREGRDRGIAVVPENATDRDEPPGPDDEVRRYYEREGGGDGDRSPDRKRIQIYGDDGNPRIYVHRHRDGDRDDDDAAPPPPRTPLAPRAPRAPRIWISPGEDGRAHGGYLGVSTLELGDQLARYFQVPEDRGVLVTAVEDGSPAEKAGLRAGDVILSVAGDAVRDSGDLMQLVRRRDPGDEVMIEVSRKGSTQTLAATLGDARDFGMLGPDGLPGDLHVVLPDLRALRELRLPDLDLRGVAPGDLDSGDWEEFHHQLRDHLRDLRQELRDALRESQRGSGREIGRREVRSAGRPANGAET